MKQLVLILLILISGCHKLWEPERHDLFTISEGNHESNERHLGYIKSPFITLQFRANDTWYYPEVFDTHWNKLGGIASNQIHQNSVRIAWRCTDGKILIAIYEYRNGERVITPLGEIDGDWTSVIIELDRNRIMWREKYYPIGTHEQKGWICYPYFGGNIPAPHDMSFEINFHYTN